METIKSAERRDPNDYLKLMSASRETIRKVLEMTDKGISVPEIQGVPEIQETTNFGTYNVKRIRKAYYDIKEKHVPLTPAESAVAHNMTIASITHNLAIASIKKDHLKKYGNVSKDIIEKIVVIRLTKEKNSPVMG